MGKTNKKIRYEVGGVVTWGNQELHFVHSVFEMPIRHPNGHRKQTTLCVYLEFYREVR